MFLATTADERLWASDPDEPMLFLGRWCFLPSRRAAWESRAAHIVTYPFDDRSRLVSAYHDLQPVLVHVLESTARALNTLHGTELSNRAWNVIIGYWLRQFVELLYERYVCLTVALPSATRTRVPSDLRAIVPIHSDEAESFQAGDRYNAQLYGQLLELMSTSLDLEPVPLVDESADRRQSLAAGVKDAVRNIATRAVRHSRFVLVSPYLPARLAVRLAWRLRSIPVPDTIRNLGNTTTAIDERARAAIASVTPAQHDCTFASFAQQLVAWNLPKIFVEDFHAARRVCTARFPRHPRLMLTANAFAANDLFNIWAAGQIDAGVPLVIVQHGGSYGTNLWNGSEDHETAIADRYYTFGWADPHKPHVTPWDGPKLGNAARRRVSRNRSILWIAFGVPRYAYRMYAVPAGPQYLDYLEDQARFARAVSDEVASRLKFRPYPIDYGWSAAAIVRDARPTVEILSTRPSLDRQLASADLCIGTHNATTFLESFVRDVPTVLFWNPRHWEMRTDAEPFFDRLRRAQILHDTPESAADFVSSLGDPREWWRDARTADAVQAFCNRYARSGSRSVDDWYHELLTVAAA